VSLLHKCMYKSRIVTIWHFELERQGQRLSPSSSSHYQWTSSSAVPYTNSNALRSGRGQRAPSCFLAKSNEVSNGSDFCRGGHQESLGVTELGSLLLSRPSSLCRSLENKRKDRTIGQKSRARGIHKSSRPRIIRDGCRVGPPFVSRQ